MRYDLTTVDGGRSYYLTQRHIDEIIRANGAGERFVTLLVNKEDDPGRPHTLVLNVAHVVAAMGTEERAAELRTPGISPELLQWYEDERQEFYIGSMRVTGRITAADHTGHRFVVSADGYRFFIEPARIDIMKRPSTTNQAPREAPVYIRGAHDEPPICLATPATRGPIDSFLQGPVRPSTIVTGGDTEALAFVRGTAYELVARGEDVRVIHPPAEHTFEALGIPVVERGDPLPAEGWGLAFVFNPSDDTIERLTHTCPRVVLVATEQGKRRGMGPALTARSAAADVVLPADEPILATANRAQALHEGASRS